MYSPLSYMCVLYFLKECGHFLIETNLNSFNAWRKDDKTRSKMSQLFFVPIIFRGRFLIDGYLIHNGARADNNFWGAVQSVRS